MKVLKCFCIFHISEWSDHAKERGDPTQAAPPHTQGLSHHYYAERVPGLPQWVAQTLTHTWDHDRNHTVTCAPEPCGARSTAVKMLVSCLTRGKVYRLNCDGCVTKTLHSCVLVPSTHTRRGTLLVISLGWELNPTWVVFFHLTARPHSEADPKWERRHSLHISVQTLMDVSGSPWLLYHALAPPHMTSESHHLIQIQVTISI